MPFVIASLAGAPLRAYLPPHEIVSAERPNLEPFVLKDAEKVADALLELESKKSMLKIAETMKLHIPPKAFRPQIATIIATKLCDFSNHEPEVEDADFNLDDFLNPIFEEIDGLDGKETKILEHWCLYVLAGSKDDQKKIEDLIIDEGTASLRNIHNLLNTPSKGVFASKVLGNLTGLWIGKGEEVVVKELPKEIHLHEPDESNLLKFQVSGNCIGEPIKVFASRRATGESLIDWFEQNVGISRHVFRFAWGSDEGSSTLAPYDTLSSYLRQDQIIYIQLGLKGGGYVRKTIMKMKSDGTNLVSSADKQVFEKAYNSSLAISSSSTFSVSHGLKELPLTDLYAIKSLVARDSTTAPNSSKLAKIHEYLGYYKDCKEVSEKLFNASEKFRKMVSDDLNGIGITEVREKIAVEIALREQQGTDAQMERPRD